MAKINKWMQHAFENAGKGLFHKQLGISPNEKIPMTLLDKMDKMGTSGVVKNPTDIGDRFIHMTLLKWRRAHALLNADRANK